MKTPRRGFLKTSIAFLIVASSVPRRSQACLVGTWKVRCPKCNQIDTVDDVTCNHICENDKCKYKSFDNGIGIIVCPDGHNNPVKTGGRDQQDTWLKGHRCAKCNKECKL